mmetsp:Transcript_18444/g.37310  ORF Transcript_18444/g.37310 Transcript_18444/m.37310 type:complete len:125 (+) Transcript_18444:1236-1610(+)
MESLCAIWDLVSSSLVTSTRSGRGHPRGECEVAVQPRRKRTSTAGCAGLVLNIDRRSSTIFVDRPVLPPLPLLLQFPGDAPSEAEEFEKLASPHSLGVKSASSSSVHGAASSAEEGGGDGDVPR